VITVFTAVSLYDLAMKKLPHFATVSYAELAVERLSPLAVHPMRDALRNRHRYEVFTDGLKMDGRTTVPSDGERI
jgi:hypothetical protein